VRNTRLILLAKPDALPKDIAQLFASSFKEVITIQNVADIGKHLHANGCLTRILLFNPKSDGTRQLLSLLARINRDEPH